MNSVPSFAAESSAQSIADLVKELKSSDNAERREASYRLSQMGPSAKEAVPALIESLEDQDTQVWFNSITAIARIGPDAEAAIPALKAQLIDSNRGRRSQQGGYRTAFALGSIGPAALPTVEEFLQHKDSPVRSGAAKAAGWMGPAAESVSDLLVVNLNDSDLEVREISAEALAKIGPGSLPKFEKTLSHPEARARAAAALGLELLGDSAKPSAQKLAGALETEQDDTAKARFIHALSRLNYPPDDFLPLLLARFVSTDEIVRQEVINALILMEPAESTSVPAMTALLNSENAAVSAQAIEVITAIGPPAGPAVPALIGRRTAADENQQAKIDAALVQIGGPAVSELIVIINANPSDAAHWSAECLRKIGLDAVPSLITSLESNDPKEQRIAIDALILIRQDAEPAVPLLINIIKNNPAQLSGPALEALAAVGAPAETVLPLAQSALTGSSPELRLSGARALASLGKDSSPALANLIRALNDQDSAVRIQSARAISAMKPAPDSAVRPLIDVIKNSDGELQVEIIQALGRMGETGAPAIPVLVELLSTANAELQAVIAESLGMMGSAASTALQEIEKGFASDQPATRIASLAAFVSIENDSARKVDVLTRTLDDPDLAVRLVAIEKIGDLGRAGEPAAEKLYELTGRAEEREAAMEVLAGMRIRSVPLLVRALQNTDPYVRQYAAERLGELRADARAALPDLKKLQDDDNDLVKRTVRNAVREIERDNK